MISRSLLHFIAKVKRGKLSRDHLRNFRLLVVACVLNFAFAIEKVFIVIGHPQSDLIWMIVYGGLGIYLAIIAFHDYVNDLYEDEDNDEGNKNTI